MTPHNLPAQTIPFIGRDAELGEIEHLLAEPACRLLTLVGTGGIGKTRLVLETSRRADSTDDVYFASLQPLTSPDSMVSTVADAVGMHFSPDSEPKQQLLNFFRDKSCLLVMDNLEHLLEGVILLSEILAVAPGLCILASSRERLNLREEWVLEVGGLNYPSSEAEADPETYSAVELFVQHARHANVNFRLTDAQKPAVIRICQLVGGMPLGIELAAPWIRVLSVDQIADEIGNSLDILETTVRNVEPRHRTMRAAFEPTWGRLSEEERGVFSSVSVFRGGFTREAAEYVVSASLRTLTALVDKSLLRVDGGGHYDVHELLRQYADEKLGESPADKTDVQHRHCAYYARYTGQSPGNYDLLVNNTALAEMRKEIENIRVAFRWAIDQHRWDDLAAFLGALGLFLELQGWYYEGADTFLRAIETLRRTRDLSNQHQTRMLGLALAWEAWFVQYLLRYDDARQIAQESVSLLLPVEDSDGLHYAYKVLAYIAGDPSEARQFSREALTHAQKVDNYVGITTMYIRLSQLHFVAGEHDEALHTAQTALEICRKHNYRYGEIWTRRRLSDVALAQGKFDEAEKQALQALKVADEIGTKNGVSLHNLTLGTVAYAQQHYHEAVYYYQQTQSSAQALNLKQFVVWAIIGLGRVAGRQGNGHEAREHFLNIIRMTKDTQNVDIRIDILAGIADLMAAERHDQRAVELLARRLQNPDNIGRYQVLDEHVRNQLEAALAPETFAAAWERGAKLKLDEVMAELSLEFSQITEADNPAAPAPSSASPLTEREHEVLRLITDGLSNREIAEHLVLAVSTVKWYVNEIFSKLHVTSRTQAVARAREIGLLS